MDGSSGAPVMYWEKIDLNFAVWHNIYEVQKFLYDEGHKDF